MHFARHLMLIDICIKFHEYSLSGFQVIEWTRSDRQTDRRKDRQTDARGKTICLPTLKGGDIISPLCYKWTVLLTMVVVTSTEYQFLVAITATGDHYKYP